MKIASVIGLFLLAYACVSAQVERPTSEVSDSYYGLIRGTVTDTKTPRPKDLPDAVISVENESLLGTGPRTATTEQAGHYEILDLPPGEYVVTTSKSGYDDSTEYVTVSPNGEAFHDVRLYKTDTIADVLWKTPVFYVILVVCLIVLFYLIKRRSSSKSQRR